MLSKPKARPAMKPGNLKDKFLDTIRNSGHYVNVELNIEHDEMTRRILDYDMYCVLFEAPNGEREVIYKHAIVRLGFSK